MMLTGFILLMFFWDTPIGLTVRESWNGLATWQRVLLIALAILDGIFWLIEKATD